MSFFKAVASIGTILKFGALALVMTSAGGFYAGVRWEKGVQYDLYVDRTELIEEQAVASLDNLTARWETAAENAKIDVQNWQIQNTTDTKLFDRVLAGQQDIGSRFDELNQDIYITTDMGSCQLSADAVRLLREASEAANSTGLPDS